LESRISKGERGIDKAYCDAEKKRKKNTGQEAYNNDSSLKLRRGKSERNPCNWPCKKKKDKEKKMLE